MSKKKKKTTTVKAINLRKIDKGKGKSKRRR